MDIQDENPRLIDGLALLRAFLQIVEPDDRRKVVELATALAARQPSPPIAPH